MFLLFPICFCKPSNDSENVKNEALTKNAPKNFSYAEAVSLKTKNYNLNFPKLVKKSTNLLEKNQTKELISNEQNEKNTLNSKVSEKKFPYYSDILKVPKVNKKNVPYPNHTDLTSGRIKPEINGAYELNKENQDLSTHQKNKVFKKAKDLKSPETESSILNQRKEDNIDSATTYLKHLRRICDLSKSTEKIKEDNKESNNLTNDKDMLGPFNPNYTNQS